MAVSVLSIAGDIFDSLKFATVYETCWHKNRSQNALWRSHAKNQRDCFTKEFLFSGATFNQEDLLKETKSYIDNEAFKGKFSGINATYHTCCRIAVYAMMLRNWTRFDNCFEMTRVLNVVDNMVVDGAGIEKRYKEMRLWFEFIANNCNVPAGYEIEQGDNDRLSEEKRKIELYLKGDMEFFYIEGDDRFGWFMGAIPFALDPKERYTKERADLFFKWFYGDGVNNKLTKRIAELVRWIAVDADVGDFGVIRMPRSLYTTSKDSCAEWKTLFDNKQIGCAFSEMISSQENNSVMNSKPLPWVAKYIEVIKDSGWVYHKLQRYYSDWLNGWRIFAYSTPKKMSGDCVCLTYTEKEMSVMNKLVLDKSHFTWGGISKLYQLRNEKSKCIKGADIMQLGDKMTIPYYDHNTEDRLGELAVDGL